MLSAALRVAYTQQTAPLIVDVVAIIAARHPRVRAMSLDRGEYSRYDDTAENLLATLMALGEDGRFGDTFTKPTTVPMLLDRAVVFDVSGIDTAEQILQAGVQLVCWSYSQSAVSAAKELADAGLREQTVYLMIMDELWRTLKASVEMVDRVDEITRLNRQKVLGQVLITHTMDDLELADADATKKAWGFVERSEMVFLGGLADGEMGNLRKVFAMSSAETGMIADWSVESAHTADDDSAVDAEQLKALDEWAVQKDGDRQGYQRLEATAVGIDTARWWLDQHSLITRPADLLELLDAAASTHAGQACENTA